MSQKIKITLTKSSIGSIQKIIGTLKGLGLKKIRSTSVLIETPEVLGMITVSYTHLTLSTNREV